VGFAFRVIDYRPPQERNGARVVSERASVLASESIVLLFVPASLDVMFVSHRQDCAAFCVIPMAAARGDEGCPRYRHAMFHGRGTLVLDCTSFAYAGGARMRALVSEHATFDVVTARRDSKRGAPGS
jgi:hypothetical protein